MKRHAMMVLAVECDWDDPRVQRVQLALHELLSFAPWAMVDVDAGEALSRLPAEDVVKQFTKPATYRLVSMIQRKAGPPVEKLKDHGEQ